MEKPSATMPNTSTPSASQGHFSGSGWDSLCTPS